jgi:hypothetical protein
VRRRVALIGRRRRDSADFDLYGEERGRAAGLTEELAADVVHAWRDKHGGK